MGSCNSCNSKNKQERNFETSIQNKQNDYQEESKAQEQEKQPLEAIFVQDSRGEQTLQPSNQQIQNQNNELISVTPQKNLLVQKMSPSTIAEKQSNFQSDNNIPIQEKDNQILDSEVNLDLQDSVIGLNKKESSGDETIENCEKNKTKSKIENESQHNSIGSKQDVNKNSFDGQDETQILENHNEKNTQINDHGKKPKKISGIRITSEKEDNLQSNVQKDNQKQNCYSPTTNTDQTECEISICFENLDYNETQENELKCVMPEFGSTLIKTLSKKQTLFSKHNSSSHSQEVQQIEQINQGVNNVEITT